jgi:predicted nucleic acid-binding protein
MNPKIRIVNTAPLIFLSKLKRLDILRQGVDLVYIPSGVLQELRIVPDEASDMVLGAIGEWLQEKSCSQNNLVSLAEQSVDRGEAEVIALALELETKDVVLDDLDARRFARRNGLEPVGTLGLMLAAKRNGLIETIKPEVERLEQAGFRATDALVREVLAAAGEV